MQHDDAVGAHTGVAGESAVPAVRRKVPFARVDLTGHARIRPPDVWSSEKGPPHVQRWVVQRGRQAGPLDQGTEVPFDHRPDPIRSLLQRDAKPARASLRARRELAPQLLRASAVLHPTAATCPDTPPIPQAPPPVAD